MAKSTSAARDRSDDPRVVNLLGRGTGEPTERADQVGTSSAFEHDWETGKLEPVVIRPQPLTIIKAPVPPPYVHDFARRAAAISNVKYVIAETGEDGMSVHITTFAERLTDEVRAQIYRLESAMITENPHVAFDFHLRRQEEAHGSPTQVTGKYYYAIWEFANAADAGTAPQAGE